MKVNVIKSYLLRIVAPWFRERMLKQDDKLLNDIIDPITNQNEDAELTDADIYQLSNKILNSASPNLITLICETMNQIYEIEYVADIIISLHHYALLTLDNFSAVIKLDASEREKLYILVSLFATNHEPLTQGNLVLFIQYASKTSLALTPEQLQRIYELTKELTPAQLQSIFAQTKWRQPFEPECKFEQSGVLALLAKKNLLDQFKLERFFKLDYFDKKYFANLLFKLEANNLLDSTALQKTFSYIRHPPKSIHNSKVEKLSRKNSSLPMSKFTLKKKNFSFFIQHAENKDYPAGTYGKIKKAYLNLEDPKPALAIKCYHPRVELSRDGLALIRKIDRNEDEDKTLQTIVDRCNRKAAKKARGEAKHEAKFHILLGNQVFYFRNKHKYFLATPWREKTDVWSVPKDTMLAAALRIRLGCLKSGLADLNKLHENFYIHGDIKTGNFIIDLPNASMRLIDFGFSHRNYLKANYSLVESFTDGYSVSSVFCDDIYCMGYVVARLFPEFLWVDSASVVHHYHHAEKTLLGCAILALKLAMMHESRDQRCRALDALLFCEGIIEAGTTLNEENLQELVNRTIDRTAATADDVLRGKLR